jgi:hypothetical protein
LLCFIFDSEDGGDIVPRKVSLLNTRSYNPENSS